MSFASQSHGGSHDQSSSSQHDHSSSRLSHKTTDFSDASLEKVFADQDVLITILTGPDIHLSPSLITAASTSTSSVRRFLPSEYGLDTSNGHIRSLLSPYRLRWEVQEELRKQQTLEWTAVYSGSVIEEALKTEGILGVDIAWGSVSAFGGREVGGEKEVVLSTYPDIGSAIVKTATLPQEDWDVIKGKGVYTSCFVTTLEEIVRIVERVEDRDRQYDWYDAIIELAKKEADERMKMGYFDGAVALLMKIAVWDEGVDAMGAWKREGGRGNDILGLKSSKSLEEVLTTVVEDVRNGKEENDCGC